MKLNKFLHKSQYLDIKDGLGIEVTHANAS